jgi:hypothetical protein
VRPSRGLAREKGISRKKSDPEYFLIPRGRSSRAKHQTENQPKKGKLQKKLEERITCKVSYEKIGDQDRPGREKEGEAWAGAFGLKERPEKTGSQEKKDRDREKDQKASRRAFASRREEGEKGKDEKWKGVGKKSEPADENKRTSAFQFFLRARFSKGCIASR